MAAVVPSRVQNATAKERAIKARRSRVSSRSNAASSTIMISPAMPSTFSTCTKSGPGVKPPKYRSTWCSTRPSAMSMSTLGMFVAFASTLNRCETITATAATMMKR